MAVSFPCEIPVSGEGGWKQVFAEYLAQLFRPGKKGKTHESLLFLIYTSHWPEVLVTVL